MPGQETELSDTAENANEEYGRGDQEFGGGAGDVEYGEQDAHVGEDGVVADPGLPRRGIVTDDEQEGVALPGSDDDAPAEATTEEE